MKKKVLAWLLSVCMVLTMMPLTSLNGHTYAAESESGTWGGIDWTLDSDGTLTIKATKGEPTQLANKKTNFKVGQWPEAVRYNSKGEGAAIEGWPYDRSKVKKLVIEEGVTSIGSFTAQGFTNLTGEVVIPSTVTYIGQEAFQKSTFTKLTFAEGGAEELCIAQGAFKNLIIEEVALPADRPVHMHAWVFNNCHNLKHATLPATLVSVHGTNHIDYFKDFNAHSNPTWTKSSEIFAYDENLETITFGSDAVRDMFFANNNGTNKDCIVAYAGLVAYSDLQNGINLSSNEEPLTLIKDITLSKTVNISENKKAALALNDKTIEGTAIFNLEKGAELKAPEGLYVTTSVEGSKVKYENGVYSVVVYVAQVGEVKYESLKEAIEACSNGETVKLLTDITYGEDDVVNAVGGATGFGQYDNPCIIGIGGTKGATDDEQHQPSNVNAVIDLNGHTITNNADAYLFMVMDNAKLTFKDSSEKQTGKIVGNTEAPLIWSTGTDTVVTIDNGSYIAANNNYGSLMWATHSGDLVINGGEFRTNTTDASSLIMRNEKDRQNSKYFISGKSTITVNGGTFYKFNPEEMMDDSTNPFTVFNSVPEDRVAEKNGDAWTVVPKKLVTIGSVEDLIAFGTAVTTNTKYQGVKVATNPDAIVTLTADLDLAGSGFVPIGNGNANEFAGTFDGQNHTISNMTLSCNYYRGVGFFRSLGNGAVIKNVTFVNANIDNGAATGANHFYGVVAGFSNNLTLDNVDVKDSSIKCKYAGAVMVGCLEGATTIKNCDIENVTLSTTSIRGAVYGTLGNSANGHTAALENNTIENAVYIVNGEIKALEETLEYGEWNDGTEYVEKSYVAQIGDKKYSTLYDAVAAADGDTITLIGDVVRAETLVVNKAKAVTIDLNGKTVSAYEELQNGPVMRILSDVTVKNGTVDGTVGINSYAFIVGNSETAGKLNIEDGTYKGVTSAVSITNGIANISGGNFSAAHDGEGTDYGAQYLLNCMDAAYKSGDAVYNITGGTFYGFNPEANTAEGQGTSYLTDEYTALEIAENAWTVVEADTVAMNVQEDVYYKDVQEAINAADTGQTVKLLVECEEALTIVNTGITLDLNGKYLTAGNLLSFGDVIDSIDGEGGVKISSDRTQAFTQLQKTNGAAQAEGDDMYIPIYDNEKGCYRFFEGHFHTAGYRTKDNVITYGFTCYFDNVGAYELISESIDSERNVNTTGVAMEFTLDWTGLKTPIKYSVTNGMLKNFADTAIEQMNTKREVTVTINVNVSGLDSIPAEGKIMLIEPGLMSTTGVKSEGAGREYIKK